MTSKVLSFVHRVEDQSGWTNAELAELYRVEHALVQAQVLVETDCGVTDEGDPWFVFCRPGGEVVVHATRFGGLYRLYSPALPQPLTRCKFLHADKVLCFETTTASKRECDCHHSSGRAVQRVNCCDFLFHRFPFRSVSGGGRRNSRSREKVDRSTHIFSQPVTTDNLFHTLVTSIKAFLEPAVDAASHPLHF